MMNVKEAYGCVRGGNISTAPNIRERVACGRKCEVSVTWYGYSAVQWSPLYALRTWSSYRPRDCRCATPVGPWLSINGWSWALVGAFLMRGRVCFEIVKSVASAARGSSPHCNECDPQDHQLPRQMPGSWSDWQCLMFWYVCVFPFNVWWLADWSCLSCHPHFWLLQESSLGFWNSLHCD